MTEDLTKSELGKTVDNVNLGRNEDAKPIPTEAQISPLEQVQMMMEENKKMVEGFRQEMKDVTANLWLSGRGMAGQSAPKAKTQEELDKEAADKLLKVFL